MPPPLGSPTLVLVPTEAELRRLEDEGGLPVGLGLLRTSGFGPIAAAARTAALLAELRPARVLLFGIAGAYDPDRHPIGSALAFSSVAVLGIGVGEGERLIPPPALGFPQWPGSGPESDLAASGPPHSIVERIDLAAPAGAAPLLLTTCAASDSPRHAGARRSRFPDAAAEDMEGFAVATACRMAGTPVAIVRGISNQVGDRDPSAWRVPAALAAARRLALELLHDDSIWSSPP